VILFLIDSHQFGDARTTLGHTKLVWIYKKRKKTFCFSCIFL